MTHRDKAVDLLDALHAYIEAHFRVAPAAVWNEQDADWQERTREDLLAALRQASGEQP